MNSKRRAIVIGLPYYAARLAQVMNEHSDSWQMRAFKGHRWDALRALLEMHRTDALICFGGPAPDAALTALARRHGVPILVVWAGTDVIHAQSNPQDLQIIKEERFEHISDGPWLVNELAVLGLTAEYEPLTDVRPGNPVQPFPQTFTVLTHLPEPRRDFYGAPTVYAVARRMPHVRFIVVGLGGRSSEAPPNVEFRGYVRDLEAQIDDSAVILRVPQHDGKSMLVLEALTRARHVVWNYKFPHVKDAVNVDDIVLQLEDLRRQHAAGTLPLNVEGRDYVLASFNRDRIARNLERRLDRLVASNTASRSPSKRVAISGLSIFCADIAGYARCFSPEWEPHLLRTNSRLGLLTAMVTIARCDLWYTIGNPVTDRWLPLAARLLRKPRVVHWVGSDILALAQRPDLCAKLREQRIIHLAETTWTANELQRLGLSPRIVAVPPRHHYGSTEPLPEKFTVMLYAPRTRLDFYGGSAFERLMKNLRDRPIRYVIVGGGDLSVPPGVDAVNLGWRNDLRDAYKDVSVLARFTDHDGLSLMVLEALSYGRHVVWTQRFDFVRQVRRYEELEKEILSLLARHERGELKPQSEASAFVRRQYSPAACIAALARAWDDAAFSSQPLADATPRGALP